MLPCCIMGPLLYLWLLSETLWQFYVFYSPFIGSRCYWASKTLPLLARGPDIVINVFLNSIVAGDINLYRNWLVLNISLVCSHFRCVPEVH